MEMSAQCVFSRLANLPIIRSATTTKKWSRLHTPQFGLNKLKKFSWCAQTLRNVQWKSPFRSLRWWSPQTDLERSVAQRTTTTTTNSLSPRLKIQSRWMGVSELDRTLGQTHGTAQHSWRISRPAPGSTGLNSTSHMNAFRLPITRCTPHHWEWANSSGSEGRRRQVNRIRGV